MMNILLLLLVCTLTCAGQLCQKQLAEEWRDAASPMRPGPRHKGRGMLWLVLSILFLGLGLLLWLAVLRVMPVSVAYPLLSLNFVLVALAARFFFHEHISRRQWLGIAWIILGIFLLSANL